MLVVGERKQDWKWYMQNEQPFWKSTWGKDQIGKQQNIATAFLVGSFPLLFPYFLNLTVGIYNFYNCGENFKNPKHCKVLSYCTFSNPVLLNLSPHFLDNWQSCMKSKANACDSRNLYPDGSFAVGCWYPTCQMLSCIGIESSHWLMNRFYYPSAKDTETRVREVQAPAQGHTAQKTPTKLRVPPHCVWCYSSINLSCPALPPERRSRERNACEELPSPASDFKKYKVRQKKKKIGGTHLSLLISSAVFLCLSSYLLFPCFLFKFFSFCF